MHQVTGKFNERYDDRAPISHDTVTIINRLFARTEGVFKTRPRRNIFNQRYYPDDEGIFFLKQLNKGSWEYTESNQKQSLEVFKTQ